MCQSHCLVWLCLLGVNLTAIVGFGQDESPQGIARRSKLYSDGAKVDLYIRLDRHVYLPFERMEITVGVHNKTSFPVEIPEPYTEKSAALDLFTPHPRWKGVFPDEFGPSSPSPRQGQLDIRNKRVPPTRMLAAGEELLRTFYSSDRFLGASTLLLTAGGAPADPGKGRLVFTTTKSSSVDFEVTQAVLEAVAYVKLTGTFEAPGWPDPRFPGKTQGTMTIQRGTIVAALGGDNSHWIVVAGLTSVKPGLLFGIRIGESVTVSHKILSAHVRVAQSTLPITSVSGVAASDDTITITWTDSSGKTDSIRVDKDRRVLPAQK